MTKLPLVWPEPYAALARRLRAIADAHPSLARTRRLLLLPVELLDALALDAEATLADDPLAAESMRLLLSAAGPHAIPSIALSTLANPPPADGSTEATLEASLESNLLNVGSLVVVALAAGRAGAAVGLGPQFVSTVLGLALAAGPADAIAGSGGRRLTEEQLRVFAAALAGLDPPPTPLALALASFLSQPFQRARWSALNELLALVSEQVATTCWDSATAEGISSVDSIHASGILRVNVAGTVSSEYWDELERDRIRVVFASKSAQPSRAARIAKIERGRGSIDIILPDNTPQGWIGFDDLRLRERSNRDRAHIRDTWRRLNRDHGCLLEQGVPLDAIPTITNPAAPPMAANNRFRRTLSVDTGPAKPERPNAGGKLVVVVGRGVIAPRGRLFLSVGHVGRNGAKAPLIGGIDA